MRKKITTGTNWENLVGYSRAVRVDNHVFVAGTTATDPAGQLVGKDDPYVQTHQILRNISSALEAAGASMEDVVRTRIFVTDISKWEAIGRAHGEVFGLIQPASTMVQITRLIHPDMIVEIEVDAFISDPK